MKFLKLFMFFFICIFTNQNVYAEKYSTELAENKINNLNEHYKLYVHKDAIRITEDGLFLIVNMPISGLKSDVNGIYITPHEVIFGQWDCRHCGTTNTTGYVNCWNCGKHRYS